MQCLVSNCLCNLKVLGISQIVSTASHASEPGLNPGVDFSQVIPMREEEITKLIKVILCGDIIFTVAVTEC